MVLRSYGTIKRQCDIWMTHPGSSPRDLAIKDIASVMKVICTVAEQQATLPSAPDQAEQQRQAEDDERALVDNIPPSSILLLAGNNTFFLYFHDLLKRRLPQLAAAVPTRDSVPNSASLQRKTVQFRLSSVMLQRYFEQNDTSFDEYGTDAASALVALQDGLEARMIAAVPCTQPAHPIPSSAQDVSNPGTDSGAAELAQTIRALTSSQAAGGSAEEPRQYDAPHFRRTVSNHFNGDGDKACFSGDLANPPSFDLWEKRYRSLVATFKCEEQDKVALLAEALSGPALSFFYDQLVPDSARSDQTIVGAPNVRSVSAAMQALEKRFCTPTARNVLKAELDQLQLSHIEKNSSGKPEALTKLRNEIARLSCNGPKEFTSQAHQILALRKALKGEDWAIAPLVAANERSSNDPTLRTLDYFVQSLVSFLRETQSIVGTSSENEDMPKAEVFYGDARVGHRPGMRGRKGRQTNLLPQHRVHIKDALRRQSQPASREKQDDLCFNCGKPGHYYRDCTASKRPFKSIARTMLASDLGTAECVFFLSDMADLREQEAGMVESDGDNSTLQAFDAMIAALDDEDSEHHSKND